MSHFKYLESYLHDHRIGVLIEIELSTEISSRVPEVRALAKDLAMHIAACDPENEADLLSQDFIKTPDKKVAEYIDEISELIEEPICVNKFIRWCINENYPGNDDPPPRDPANLVRLNAASR